MAHENLHFLGHTHFLVKLQCSVFSSATFRGQQAGGQQAEIRQMNAGQNNKYDIT